MQVARAAANENLTTTITKPKIDLQGMDTDGCVENGKVRITRYLGRCRITLGLSGYIERSYMGGKELWYGGAWGKIK